MILSFLGAPFCHLAHSLCHFERSREISLFHFEPPYCHPEQGRGISPYAALIRAYESYEPAVAVPKER